MFTHRSSLTLLIVLVSHLWNVVHGLECYSCQRFLCDEDRGNCYDMRQWSITTNNHSNSLDKIHPAEYSPKCPSPPSAENFPSLNSSTDYIEACNPQESSGCGSTVIRITAVVTRIPKLNETEYPILNPPNYYHSTLIIVGCVGTPGAQKENDTTSPGTGQELKQQGNCSENVIQMEYETTSYGNPVTINMKSEQTLCTQCNQSLCNFKIPPDNVNLTSSSPSAADGVTSSHPSSSSSSSDFGYEATSWPSLLLLHIFSFTLSCMMNT